MGSISSGNHIFNAQGKTFVFKFNGRRSAGEFFTKSVKSQGVLFLPTATRFSKAPFPLKGKGPNDDDDQV